MHKIRGQARNVAWTDSKNPFAKRAYSNSSKTRDVQSQLEAGNGAPLFRPNTDDPYDYPAQRSSDGLAPEWSVDPQTRSPTTLPAAVSRKRTDEPGDHIGQMPRSSSPPGSLRKLPVQGEVISGEKAVDVTDGSDRTLTEQYDQGTNDTEKPKKRGIKGWFKRSSTDKKGKDSADDNNGKNKKTPQKFTAASQIRATILSSWINLLLIASPVGIALYYAHVNAIVVFVVNFIAIVPLAGMLSYATEEIALRTGEVIGGLLNASFGNAVELIVSIIALTQNQILIVQTSLIGSILSNLLLVLGMCFFAGGVNRMEQAFNMTVAQTASSLLFLAVSSLLIPTAFNEWANTGQADKTATSALVPGEAALSRATAILLLIVYASYLFFQLKSHVSMYSTASEKNKTRDFSKQKDKMKNMVPSKIRRRSVEVSSTNSKQNEHEEDDEDEPEQPQLSLWVAIATLAASTVLVALNAEYLVDSIDAITCGGGISKNFVGLILLPIVGNAAEHATAVTVAIKDKMDLAIGVAVGSSMQIALLVLPLMVVLGWIIGKDDMTLYFDGFQIAMLFVSILLVNYLIQDGKSHWLEGVLLMILYVIIAVAAWFYPTAPGLSDCPAS